MQPRCRQFALNFAAGKAGEIFAETQVDFQAVRHDRLDFERLLERDAADAHPRHPVAGRRVRRSRHREGIEAVQRLFRLNGFHKLALRVQQFEHDWMPFRQRVFLIPEQKRQIHRVTRTPDAALAVNHPFDPFFDLFAAYIETAERQGRAVVQFQKTGLIAEMSGRHERLAVEMERRLAVDVGFRHAHPQLLIIEQFDFHAFKRQRGFEIGRKHGHVVQGAFGDQTDVRDQHVARHLAIIAVILHVIRSVAGVIAIVMTFVPAIVSLALFIIIPGTAVAAGCIPVVRDFRQHDFFVFRHVRALIDHVRALERERQRVHAAGEILN